MVRFRLYFYIFSLILTFISVGSLVAFGLPLGTDFTGGSLLEVQFFSQRPSHEELRRAVEGEHLANLTLQDSGDRGIIMRFGSIDEQAHQNILEKIRAIQTDPAVVEGGENEAKETFTELRFDSIGPAIGKQTRERAMLATGLVLAAILIYVSWAFRKVSYPMRAWHYAIIVLVTLFHDLIVAIGLFALFAQFWPLEVGVPFVAAVLTTLGYSVNDTIVVFDRIRENLSRQVSRFSFEEVVGASIVQTFVRSFNNSLTAIIVLVAVLVLGGDTLRSFILTLIIGIAVGTYSSICIASPLLVSWYRKKL